MAPGSPDIENLSYPKMTVEQDRIRQRDIPGSLCPRERHNAVLGKRSSTPGREVLVSLQLVCVGHILYRGFSSESGIGDNSQPKWHTPSP